MTENKLIEILKKDAALPKEVTEKAAQAFETIHNENNLTKTTEANQKENRKNRERKTSHRLQYTAAAAIVFLICASSVMASDNIRFQIKNVIYTLYPGYATIENQDAKNNSKKKENKKTSENDSQIQEEQTAAADSVWKEPSYLPEGFQESSRFFNEELQWLMISYSDDDHIITYQEYNIEEVTVNTIADGEPEEISIGNETAFCFTGTDEMEEKNDSGVSDTTSPYTSDHTTIFYEKNSMVYMISGHLTKNELAKILESITPQKSE